MKKSISIIIITSVLVACEHPISRQQKAEHLVKAYLKSALNDPGSYESVSFDTLSISYEDYASGDPIGRKLDKIAASFTDTSSKYKKLSESEFYSAHMDFKKYRKYQKLDALYANKSDSVESIIKNKAKDYKGKIDGYAIKHTYRAKNGFGALTLSYTDFWIDSSLTKIINVQDGYVRQH